MKSIVINEYGSHKNLQYVDSPKPSPLPNDVLVRVHAASINPVDWKIREGYLKDHIPITFPFVLGFDFSGEVVEVGSAVTDYAVGDQVYGSPSLNRNGSYAEFLAVDSSRIALKPTNLNHIQAASIPLAGITAWQALKTTAGMGRNSKVVIIGASGGVGTLAVQLAKSFEAIVIGICSEANTAMVRALSADATVAYDKQEFTESLEEVDIVFDCVGGDAGKKGWGILKKPGGHFVSIVDEISEELRGQHPGIKADFVFIEPNHEILVAYKELIESHKIKPVIDAVFSFSEIEDAHLHSQSGRARGKIILEVAR